MESIKYCLNKSSIHKRIQTPNILDIPIRDIRNKLRRVVIIQIEYIKGKYLKIFPANVTRIYLVLTKYAHYTTQSCFPSLETLMKESGVSNKGTTIKATRILEAHSLILISRSTKRRTNTYFLLDPQKWKDPDINLINSIKKGKRRYQNNEIKGSSSATLNKDIRSKYKERRSF